MRKVFLVFILSVMAVAVFAQDIAGKWKGTLDVQGYKLQMIFNVSSKDGNYSATLDIPEQKAREIACSTIYADDNIEFNITSVKGQYKGKITGDTIKGVFSQQGMSFPLDLVRSSAAPATLKKYTIRGSVVDSIGNTVAYPTISIKNDSTEIEFAERYSGDADGTFEIETKAAPGVLWVNIAAQTKTSVDKKVTLAESNTVELGKVALRDGEELSAISITAYKPLVTQSLDRINYDIEADPESKTNSVMEMLRKVPMVTIDHEEKIKVKGSSNFKIYINGKPSNIITQNPKDVLKSMPASSIKKIEVITDPGAKYDAEGVTAILNIVTQSALQGYQGSLRSEVGTTGDWSVGGYFTTKVGKFGVTANYNYYNFQQPVWIESKFENLNPSTPYKTAHNKDTSIYSGGYHWGNAELSYEFDSLNLLSASLGIKGAKYHQEIPNSYSIFTDHSNNIVSAYNRNMYSTNNNVSWSGNIDYQRSFKKPDQLLTLSYNFSLDPDDKITITKLELDPKHPNILGTSPKNIRYSSIGKSDEHTWQIDYTEPFDNNKHSIEAGVKYILRYNESDNTYRLYNPATQAYDITETNPDGTKRIENDMTYYQHILGAYASYTFKLQKFSFRLGGRFEGTRQDVRFWEDNSKNFKINFTDLIPSVSLAYNPNFASNIKLSYNNGISRPSISYLNPYIDNSSVYTIQYGNPNLKSERSHNISLSYGMFSQRFNMNATLSGNMVNNSIEQEIRVANDGIIHSTYANIGKKRGTNLNLFFNYNPLQWLGFWGQGALNYSYYHNQNYTEDGFSFMGFGGINLTMPWKLKFNAYAGGSTSSVNYKMSFPSWYYYAFSLSRSFLKNDRLTVSVSATNPFEKYRDYHLSTQEKGVFVQNMILRQQARQFNLSISWRFGEMKAEIKKAERGITNDDLKKGENKSGGGVGQQGGQ
ncbi:MAG: outer membrane beta-barrel family protein [Porphyromonadaceae bacterium]|nr:outer membrane beta-barrel family protein [Porphyromonadaceae bacterium]